MVRSFNSSHLHQDFAKFVNVTSYHVSLISFCILLCIPWKLMRDWTHFQGFNGHLKSSCSVFCLFFNWDVTFSYVDLWKFLHFYNTYPFQVTCTIHIFCFFMACILILLTVYFINKVLNFNVVKFINHFLLIGVLPLSLKEKSWNTKVFNAKLTFWSLKYSKRILSASAQELTLVALVWEFFL